MSQFLKRGFISLTIVFISIYTLISPLSATNNQKTIRVAISDTPYLSQKQSDGSFDGIIIDYLEEISKYAGWKIEYVEGPMSTLIKQLQNGDVDLMGGVLKNKDTEKIYDFATFSSGFSYGALITKQKNSQYISMDYSSFKDINVGIYTKATNRLNEFNEYCKQNQLSFKKVLYEDSSLLRKDLNEGKLDAILSNDMSCQDDEKILMRFTMTPFYFAVPKGHSDLLKELNTSLSTLQQVSPQFGETVYQKHVLAKRQTDIFTLEEKAYIKTQKTLKVAVVNGLNPAENWDDKTNTAVGIAPDILDLIGENTDLKFEYIHASTLVEAREMLRNKEVDITLRPTGSSIEETEFITTKSYLESQLVKVYHLNPSDSAKDTEAVLAGYHEFSKDKKYHSYESMEECVQAVINGEVESLTTSSLLLENYPTIKGNKRLYVSPIPNSRSSSLFIINKDASPTLISILDKSIQNLTEERIKEIVYQHTLTHTPSLSFLNLYEIYPTEVAWGVAAFLFIASFVAVLLLLLNRARLRLARENILQEESYKIVGDLSGEQIFFYDFNTNKLTLPDSFSNALGVEKNQIIKYEKDNTNDPLQKLLQIFYSENEQVSFEFSCKLQDGSEGWFRIVGTILPNPDGKPLRGIGGLKSIQKEMHQLIQLEKQATTDYLTDLSNRQHCESLIRDSFNKNKNGTLLIIDIDYFKQINDQMGHDAGDQLLREFAQLLQHQFTNSDILGRWGGDEFIAFIQNITDKDIITSKLEVLCNIMNRKFIYGEQETELSISVGVAISDGTLTYDALFQKADKALYQVKSSSRNSFYIDDSHIKR